MTDQAFAYFEGKIVPLAEAKVSVVTHAFNYGTGCFEGIRGYWNAEEEQIYLFRLAEHFDRLRDSAKILRMTIKETTEELCRIACELVRHDGFREDCYVRPIVYLKDEKVGVRLNGLTSAITMFVVPFGAYIDIDAGTRCMVSSWRRVDDNVAPARAKVTGIYINSALAKTEAEEGGFDEAIMLTHDGHVSEGSAENIFLLRHGSLITPPASDNILEGITRSTVIQLAQELLNVPVVERSIDRSELYVADEVFLCGTGAQVSPVVEIDRRAVGTGRVGDVTRRLQRAYFDIVRGRDARYRQWCSPVYAAVRSTDETPVAVPV
jgi:branched-chain amino acid aminotransferase